MPVETCSVCGGKSGSVVVVMETSVSEVSDLACGEQLIWDCSPVIYLCLALPPAVGVSCQNIRGVDKQAELGVLQFRYSNKPVTIKKNHEGLSEKAFKYCISVFDFQIVKVGHY